MLPLHKRIKEIFKKYGVTVTSIVLAAGITIKVVMRTVTNALKAMGKALGATSFLFQMAGQVVGFFAEHTWLLILPVVAFLFERYLKRR